MLFWKLTASGVCAMFNTSEYFHSVYPYMYGRFVEAHTITGWNVFEMLKFLTGLIEMFFHPQNFHIYTTSGTKIGGKMPVNQAPKVWKTAKSLPQMNNKCNGKTI